MVKPKFQVGDRVMITGSHFTGTVVGVYLSNKRDRAYYNVDLDASFKPKPFVGSVIEEHLLPLNETPAKVV